jgi:hypothetical protein
VSEVRADQLNIGDVVADPASDRTIFGPAPTEGMSRRVRVLSWRTALVPGQVAFWFEHVDGLLAGHADWASYPPDRPLIRLEMEPSSAQ